MKYPTLCGSVLITGRKAIVRLADENIIIEAPGPLLREIFRLCDGQTTLQVLRQQLGPRWDAKALNRLIATLYDNGVLVNADEIALQSWRYVENPRSLGEDAPPQVSRMLPLLASRQAARKVTKNYRSVPRFRLRSLIERRASSRTFSGQPTPFASILAMLWAAYGVQAKRKGLGAASLHSRTVPSGGGIYPLRLILVNMKRTQGLREGVYAVHFRHDQSIGFRPLPVPWQHIFRAFGDPSLLRQAHGVIVFGGDVKLSGRKYGNRALLYVSLEAGHAAQNALLAATEFGTGAVEIGGFLEAYIRQFFPASQRALPLTTIVFGQEPTRKQLQNQSASTGPLATFRWVDVENSQSAPSFFLGMAEPDDHRRDADYCWGRSRDPLAAYDKTMAEATERRACATPEKIYRAPIADLDHALDPRDVVSYHSRQYSTPEFPFVPFDNAKRWWWKDGYEHFSGKKISVLADLVYFGDKARAKLTRPYTTATTSGVAAFTSREIALERAVLELCERDAFMRAWFFRTPTPRIRHDGLPNRIQKRVAALVKLGLRVSVKDLTQDFVPVVLVFAQHGGKTFTVVGASADYDPETALDHALMEVESTVFMRLQQKHAGRIRPAEVIFSSGHADLYAQPKYFRRADFLAEGPPQAGLSRKRAGISRTWQGLQDRLHRDQRRLVSLDITPAVPTHGPQTFFVMRAIIPGLIPINFGFGTEPLGTVLSARPPSFGPNSINAGRLFPHPFA